MLQLFRGELSYTDITRGMVYKDMISLRDVRVERLAKDRENSEKQRKDNDSQRIRETLLSTDPNLRQF